MKVNRILVVALAIGFCVVALILVFAVGTNPAGMYEEPGFATSPPVYYEFSDGKVSLVSTIWTNAVGIYMRKDNGWVLKLESGFEFRLKASLFSLRVAKPPDGEEKRFRRLFLRPRQTLGGGEPKKADI